MRDLFFKCFLVGILFFITPSSFAESYRVLVLPDNIVTDTIAVDSFIYNATSEFFADEIVTILNTTDYISSPNVSDIRSLYKTKPSSVTAAKNLTAKFRNSYNVDYKILNKLATVSGARYVLLITSYIDSENYILRRTFWDFLNIPGATVVDPAYKISTYAVLIDTKNNLKIWSNTYYKTISVCENRIITRGISPQAEQLEKIRDYSRLICPQIAQNIQRNILTTFEYEHETQKIDCDLSNLDNIFTKKYRAWNNNLKNKYSREKKNAEKRKQQKIEQQVQQEQKNEAQLEVKATPLNNNSSAVQQKEEKNDTTLNPQNSSQKDNIKSINYYEPEGYDVKKIRQTNLYNQSEVKRPELRNYYK